MRSSSSCAVFCRVCVYALSERCTLRTRFARAAAQGIIQCMYTIVYARPLRFFHAHRLYIYYYIQHSFYDYARARERSLARTPSDSSARNALRFATPPEILRINTHNNARSRMYYICCEHTRPQRDARTGVRASCAKMRVKRNTDACSPRRVLHNMYDVNKCDAVR